MQKSEIQLLTSIYNRYLETGKIEYSISFTELALTEKRDTINVLNILEEYGYIKCIARAAGFYQIQLTVSGIKFIEYKI